LGTGKSIVLVLGLLLLCMSRTLMFPLWFALLGGYFFVFLDVGPSILFLVFPLFWILLFIYDWQGFIQKEEEEKNKNSKPKQC
jgi:uncharacterized membrane protein